ncbi:MAG: zinc-binding alcohol dehydrogenase [Clostridia bacterium]
MPKELISYQPHQMIFDAYEDAPLLPGQIRVKTEFAAPKHGTEMHGFRSTGEGAATYYDGESHTFLTAEPTGEKTGRAFRPGNMWVGHIVDVASDVENFKVGERVAGYGTLRETQTVSVNKPKEPGYGGISDLLKVPEDMKWQQAIFYDPCQFALSGIRDSHVRLGDVCWIVGLGAIGMMAAQMAKLSGAKLVIVSDPIEKRRKVALENGADIALDPLSVDTGYEVKRLTGKHGADVVIETSGTYPGLQGALRGVTYGGRIAIVGWFNPCHGNFDLGQEAHMNNATIFFSRACSEPNPDYPRWDWTRINETCWALLCEDKLHCDNLVDPVVSFEISAETYMDCVDQNPAKSLKMGVIF